MGPELSPCQLEEWRLRGEVYSVVRIPKVDAELRLIAFTLLTSVGSSNWIAPVKLLKYTGSPKYAEGGWVTYQVLRIL